MGRVAHGAAQSFNRRHAVQMSGVYALVFVPGDNRLLSTDSRNFSTVPMQDILGRARQVWHSSDTQGVRWGRLGLVLN
jgi:type IV secretory pathway protease TraF